MKILLIADCLGKGGKERRITELIKYFHNSDNKFILAVLDKHIEYKEIYSYTDEIILLPERSFFGLFKSIIKLIGICHKQKPDVVHSWGDLSILMCAFLKIIFRINIINSAIASAPSPAAFKAHKKLRQYFNRMRFSYFYSNIITSNSKAGLISFKVPKEKSHCIYNGFNFSRIQNVQNRTDVLNKIGLPENNFIIGMVAAFEERKDHRTLLNAAKIILRDRKDCQFVLIGDGPLRKELVENLDNEFRNNIHFLGIKNNAEDFINSFDICLLATNPDVHGEGISNSILEYMALKKSVIATEGGGTNEIVIDNYNGILVKHKDAEDLASKINFLLANPNKREEFANNGFSMVNKIFTIEKMCKSFEELYQNLAQKQNVLSILKEIKHQRYNSKGIFFIVFFRTSNFFSKNIFLKIIGFPIRFLYKITVQWILGIDIPDITQIGFGFKLFHGQSLVVNAQTVIGSNVTLRHNTTIGNSKKDGRSPKIGNNVEVGANSVIIGEITIGNNSVIGAGSVVIKNVPPYSLVVGNPARVVKTLVD